jgi:hypothetical protein
MACMLVQIAITLLAFISASAAQPPSPYIDRGACPFECCVYRSWQARQSLPVFDRPNGKSVSQLNRGEWIQALTGEIHSVPLKIVATRDVPEAGIHPRDTFYVLHYEGEGYWKIWFKGKLFSAEAYDTRSPKTEWWAQIKRNNGSTGWVRADKGAFNNQDQCG